MSEQLKDQMESVRLRERLDETYAENAKLGLELRETRDKLATSEYTWRCFHCGFETASATEAEAHFGERDDAEEFKPLCKWWSKLSAEERAAQFQDVLQQLNQERDEASRLLRKVEGLEYRVESQESEIASRFKGCRSINDAWHAFDIMEGRALWAEQQLRLADGAGLIAAERARQVAVEGWTPEHDDAHATGELLEAALAYGCHSLEQVKNWHSMRTVHGLWPWDVNWWKPSDDPIRNLVKAGALIAAEIDRLKRKEQPR